MAKPVAGQSNKRFSLGQAETCPLDVGLPVRPLHRQQLFGPFEVPEGGLDLRIDARKVAPRLLNAEQVGIDLEPDHGLDEGDVVLECGLVDAYALGRYELL